MEEQNRKHRKQGEEHRFFCHKKCEYFPCHATNDPDNFNCLFCFCPLYVLQDRCGGNFSYTKTGYKDCSKCTVPHRRENYDYIVGKYKEIVAAMPKRRAAAEKILSGEEGVLLERLRKIPTANVSDGLGEAGIVLDSGIRPVNAAPLAGTAFPVACPPGDNLTFHCALELAGPGDIVVVTNQGGMERALCGEMMAAYAKSRGIAGFVVDGCIRDRETLSSWQDFPIYARGSVPRGPDKERIGAVGCPVALGGCTIQPGDILLGDADGLLVIPRGLLSSAVEKGTACAEREEQVLAEIAAGRGFDRPFLKNAMKKLKNGSSEENL